MLVKINFICVQPFEFQAAFNAPVGMQHSSRLTPFPNRLPPPLSLSPSSALCLPHSLMKTKLNSRSPIVPISNLRPKSLRNQLCNFTRPPPPLGRAHKIAYQKFTRFALPNMLMTLLCCCHMTLLLSTSFLWSTCCRLATCTEFLGASCTHPGPGPGLRMPVASFIHAITDALTDLLTG